MNRPRRFLCLVASACLGAGTLLAAAAFAQSSGGAYALERHVIASGGGASTGGSHALDGTIGQPDAHPASTGGDYRLSGGFRIQDAPVLTDAIFADSFE